MVSVTIFTGLVAPTMPLPKVMEEKESVTGAIPAAERATVCGVALALVVTLSVPAVWAPSETGVTESEMVQADPPASEAPHVVETIE